MTVTDERSGASGAVSGPAPVAAQWRIGLVFALLMPVFALGSIVAFLGLYARPASDDYRMVVFIRNGGISEITGEMWARLTGRVGNAMLGWVVYGHPDIGMRLIPLAAFTGAGMAVFLLLRAAVPLCGYHVPSSALVLGGFGAGTVILLGQPLTYHIVYWSAGVITHSIPFIILILLITLGLKEAGHNDIRLVVGFVGSLFIATVNEAISLVWFGLAMTVVATSLILRRVEAFRPRFFLAYTAVLTVGSGIGLGVLWAAPGNASRRAGVPSAARGPLDPRLLGDAAGMTISAFRCLFASPGPWAALALGCVVGLLARHTGKPAAVSRGELAWLLCGPAVAAIGTAFAVQTALRFGFGRTPWICYRAWPNFTFVLVIALFFYGFLIARAVLAAGRRLGPPGGYRAALPMGRWTALSGLPRLAAQVVPGGLGLVACGVLLVTFAGYALNLEDLGGRMVVRAAAWDAESAEIAKARAQGRTVVPFSALPIEHLWAPYTVPSARDWVAATIARYFHVSKIIRPPSTDRNRRSN